MNVISKNLLALSSVLSLFFVAMPSLSLLFDEDRLVLRDCDIFPYLCTLNARYLLSASEISVQPV
jgi:hypothetical protein